jgi:hypothetical protein
MQMKCLYRTILRGDVVKPGQVLDLTDAECKTDVVKKFFVKADGSASGDSSPAAGQTKAGTVVAGLTRDQVIMKLNQAGVGAKGNASNAALAELYNQTFANVAEATAK